MQELIRGLKYIDYENDGYCFGIVQGIISNIYRRCQASDGLSKSQIDIDGEDSAIQTMLFLNEKLRENFDDPTPVIETINFIQAYLGELPYRGPIPKYLMPQKTFLFYHENFMKKSFLLWQSLSDDEKMKLLVDQLSEEKEISNKNARAREILESYKIFKQFLNIRIFLDSVFLFQEHDHSSQKANGFWYEVPNTTIDTQLSWKDKTSVNYDVLGGALPRVDITLCCILFDASKLQEIANLAILSDKTGIVVINTSDHQSMLVFSNDKFYLINETLVEEAKRDQIESLLEGHAFTGGMTPALDGKIPFAYIQIYFPLQGLQDICYRRFQGLQENFYKEVQSTDQQYIRMICGDLEEELDYGFIQECFQVPSEHSVERQALLSSLSTTLALILNRHYLSYLPTIKSSEVRSQKLAGFNSQLSLLHKRSAQKCNPGKRKPEDQAHKPNPKKSNT